VDELLLALRLILALLLYLFLGVAFYVLWRGLKKNEKTAPAAHTPAYVTIEQGKDQRDRVVLRPVTGIGRASSNVLVVSDLFASTNHAIILWRENLWWLEDLNSHNGTYLNNEKVVQPLPLTSGDLIRIGETVIRFEITEQATE
jgi:pSer/pThr/pTyr-binding forkhead associated (FHA) protein